MTKKLYYIMDVHCGWCYGNSENISTLELTFQDRIDIEILVGGMWLPPNAPIGGSQLYDFIKTHAPRMEATTGAQVTPLFYSLTQDSSYTFSSLEPSCAITLIKEMNPSKALSFSSTLQKAIFKDGKRLDQLETYIPILKRLNLDLDFFKAHWLSNTNITNTTTEFNLSNNLVSGFPTLLIDIDGQKKVLASGYFNLTEMTQTIQTLI